MSVRGALPPTPGQTVGPFFHYGVEFPRMNEVVPPHSPGAVHLEGVVSDGAGVPIPDALVEIWGADADGSIPSGISTLGRQDGGAFTGFGRCATDSEGQYSFWTREPGSSSGSAPFLATIVFARGLTDKLHTRIYLPGDDRIAADAFLSSLSAPDRGTLIATRTADGRLRHDIRLQGERETVFLAF